MPLTVAQAITKFRDIGGEQSTVNPTNTVILKYINLARGGDESPLLDLYPKLQNEMGTLVNPGTVNFTAGTTRYTLSTIPSKIDHNGVFVKYSADDDYRTVDNVIAAPLNDLSPEAHGARSPRGCVVGFGMDTGAASVDVYPEPGQAVTAGLKYGQLVLPTTDLTSSDSFLESNRVVLITVKKALALYYHSQKRRDLWQEWEEKVAFDIAKAIGNSPGRQPEQRIPTNRGNLSRFLGHRRIR